jgi:hypothetical protein
MTSKFPDYVTTPSQTPPKKYKEMQQRGYKPSSDATNPGAFVALPDAVVEKIGLYTHMGARIECAVLARLLYEDRNRDTSERAVPFQGHGEYTKPAGTFILSMERVAKDLWLRWFHQDAEGEGFERFYDRLRKAVSRLEDEGWVRRLGHPFDNRCLGYVWSFQGTFLAGAAESLPRCPYEGACLLHSGAPEDGDVQGHPNHTNVVDVIGEAFVAANPKEFTRGECVTSLDVHGRGTYHDIFEWHRTNAMHGAAGPRFTTIGAWRRGEEGRADKPHTVPWITWDIDSDDLQEAMNTAQRIVENLEHLGASLEKIHVSFSGKKGFHIRLPSGMAGAPVFANAAECERVLREFCEWVADEETDLATCNPRQNIRMIGSKRKNGFHVVAWTADEFQSVTLQRVVEEARTHKPHEIGHIHPLSRTPEPGLVEVIVSAMDKTRKAQIPSFHDTESSSSATASGAMQRALEGCEEGQIWWDKGDKFHEGRSKLLFVAACGLLRDHSRRKAWEKLKEVNDKCDPSMRKRELRGRYDSAVRTLERDGAL